MSRRSTASLAVAVIVGAALLLGGCAQASNSSTSAGSIADQVVALIKPVPGELISPPVGDATASPDRYLIFRFDAATKSHPDLFKGVQPAGSSAPSGAWLWTFSDGSTMRWVPKPAPQADGIGGPLDHVEVTRP
jgi:hypothetical protein